MAILNFIKPDKVIMLDYPSRAARQPRGIRYLLYQDQWY